MAQKSAHQDKKIEIDLFGGLTVRVGGDSVSDEIGRARQVWFLFEYLILNRRAGITQANISEALWGTESCDDPANALKNLVYRLRRLLEPVCQGGWPDFIVTGGGTYSFNNSLKCVIDAEELERLYKQADASELSSDRRLDLQLRAVSLYKGDLLPKAAMEDWVISPATYYRGLYISCVKGAAGELIARHDYGQALEILNAACLREPFDEELHELIIRALLLSGDRRRAAEHYSRTSEAFYEKLGVRLSPKLRQSMRDIIRGMDGAETDLDAIRGDLSEDGTAGAFICDYGEFQKIYRIEARMTERFGQSVFVALLTLAPVPGHAGLEDSEMAEEMSMLENVIVVGLRKSDVVSRFSKTQYILMLPSLTYENGLLVLGRLSAKFAKVNKRTGVRLVTKLGPLDPPGSAGPGETRG